MRQLAPSMPSCSMVNREARAGVSLSRWRIARLLQGRGARQGPSSSKSLPGGCPLLCPLCFAHPDWLTQRMPRTHKECPTQERRPACLPTYPPASLHVCVSPWTLFEYEVYLCVSAGITLRRSTRPIHANHRCMQLLTRRAGIQNIPTEVATKILRRRGQVQDAK